MENDAQAFRFEMDMESPFLVYLREIDSLDTFFFEFCKLVALSETGYLFIIFYKLFNKNIQCCLVLYWIFSFVYF